MSDINLLENQLQSDQNLKTKLIFSRLQKWLTLLLVLSFILTGGLYFYGSYIDKSQAAASERALEEAQLLTEKIEEGAALSRSLEYSRLVLENHYYWTNLFKAINSVAVSGVRFRTLNASSEGRINLGVSAVDFTTMAAFVKKLNELEGVLQTGVGASTLQEEAGDHQYNFNLTVRFDPEILFNKE